VLVEGRTTHTATPISPRGADLLSPEEFTSFYPYVVRYANNTQHHGDSLIFTPHSGEHDSFGVFFYALADLSQAKNEEYKNRYLFKSEDVVASSSIPVEVREKGVLTLPGKKFKEEEERIRQMLYPGRDVTTLKIGEHYTVGETVYKENLILRIAPESFERLPILTVPTVLTLNTACRLG
jgi:hypothetical protein